MIKKIILGIVTSMLAAASFAVVNINTASQTELQTLKGIGAKKVAAIVEFRQKNGEFKTVEDLAKVNGIGAKTVEKLKSEISVSNAPAVENRNPKPLPATAVNGKNK